MGKLGHEEEARRAAIEDALSSLGCVEAKRELLELRTQQAIRRDSSLRPLLEPQLELIDEIYRNVGRASTCLGQYHTVREQHGW
jgi:ribosomal protein L29